MPITGVFTKRGAIPGYTFNGGFWPVSAETGRPPAGAARAMGFRQCRAGNKPCGKTCIRADRVCKVGQRMFGSRVTAGAPKQRKEPTCTEGRSYKCGKACISVARPCRKTNTPAPAPLQAGGNAQRVNDMWLGLAAQAKPKVMVRNQQGEWVRTRDGEDVCTSQPYRRIRQTGPNTFII